MTALWWITALGWIIDYLYGLLEDIKAAFRARGKRTKHATFMVASGVINAVVAFGVNLALVRYIDPEGFGRFAIAVATLAIIFTFFSMRLAVLIVRYPDDEFDDAARRRMHRFVVIETVALASAGAIWLTASGLWSRYNGMLLVAMTLASYVTAQRAVYERGQHYVKLAQMETGARSASHVLALGLAIAGWGEGALYARELAFPIICAVWLRALGAMRFEGAGFVAKEHWRDLMRRVRGIWADGVLESLFERAKVLVAGAIGGEAGAGFFFQAHRLAMVPLQFMAPVASRLALNWFSRENDHAARARRRRQLVLLSLLPLSLTAIVIVLFADPVIPWLFGERWSRVVPVLIALLGAVLFTTPFETYRVYLIAMPWTRVLVVVRLIQLASIGLACAPLLWDVELVIEVAAIAVSFAYFVSLLICAVAVWLKERESRASAGQLPTQNP